MNHNRMHPSGSVNGNEEGGGKTPLLRRHASYGIECMQLNTSRMMNAIVVPIYHPLEEFDFGASNNLFEVADIVTMESSDDEARADVFCDSVCPLTCME